MQSFREIRQRYDRILEQLTRVNTRHADQVAYEQQLRREAQQKKNAAMEKLTQFQNQWRYFFDFVRRSQKTYGTQGMEYTFSNYTPQAMQDELQELMNEASRTRDPANRHIREQIVAGALIEALTYISGQEVRVKQELRLTDGGPVSMLPEGSTGQISPLSTQIRELFEACWEWREACEDVMPDALPLFGFQARTFPILKGDRKDLPQIRGRAWPFDENEKGEGIVFLPEPLPGLAYFACRSRKNAGKAVTHLLHYAVNQLQIHSRQATQAHWRTVILDTTTLYDTSIGPLTALKGDCTSAYAAPACHSLEEAKATLDELWSLAHTEPAERLLVVRCSLQDIQENQFRRLVNNAEELKLTVILLNETLDDKVPSYMKTANAACYTDSGDYFVLEGVGRFEPLCPHSEFTPRQAEQVRNRLRHKEVYDFPMKDFGQIAYHPGNRDLQLPYGVTDDGTVCVYNTQDNEEKKGGGGNAGFLVGVSGSGKSTLIHDLIASLILNYHPDDVELWLADFKMKEFAHYVEHWPPHVRYILLDESPDMIFSLVDKLTEEMKRRQRIIAASGASWYQDPKIHPRLPLLFVIIDEFSRMSQAISEHEDRTYVTKLQNLFTQARDQGIRILMSSQFYTSGVEALNDQSKGQIGIRLAMMTTNKDEMTGTLAIPDNMITDDQKAMISTLPRYKVLTYEDNALKKVNVYNLSGEIRKRLDGVIDELNRHMIPVDDPQQLDAGDARCYLRKEHLFVSGDPTSLDRFEDCRDAFQKELEQHYLNGDKGAYFWMGRARRLEATSSMRLLRADNENLLICVNFMEEDQMDGMISVVRSLILSAEMQGISAQIWMHEPTEEMRHQWADAEILTKDEEIEEESKRLDILLDEERLAQGADRLLILVDPVELSGERKLRMLKDRLRPKKKKQDKNRPGNQNLDNQPPVVPKDEAFIDENLSDMDKDGIGLNFGDQPPVVPKDEAFIDKTLSDMDKDGIGFDFGDQPPVVPKGELSIDEILSDMDKEGIVFNFDEAVPFSAAPETTDRRFEERDWDLDKQPPVVPKGEIMSIDEILSDMDRDGIGFDFGESVPVSDTSQTPEPSTEEEKEEYPSDRLLENRIRYFIAAGSEQGLHVIFVVPKINSLNQSGLLPDLEEEFNKLILFRHQMAFHMSEDDADEFALKKNSCMQLVNALSRCFLYRDGIRTVMREPYRLL